MADPNPPKMESKGVTSSEDVLHAVAHHMPPMDGIRGIAVLLVLMVHSFRLPTSNTGLAYSIFRTLAQDGWTGVDLFFVLSGFLITGILLDTKEAENYFSSFYLRRVLRIFPLSYATLFVGFVLCPLLGKLGVPYMPHTFSSLQLWYWFYIGNWASLFIGHRSIYLGHFWSLCIEEQFYLVWPWVVFVTTRRTLAKICVALPVGCLLLRIAFQLRGVNSEVIYFLTVTHSDGLAMGALAALMVRDREWIRRIRLYSRHFIYGSLAALGVMTVTNRGFHPEGWVFVFGLWPLEIFFTGILLLSVPGMGAGSKLQKCLGMGWLRSFGKYSYAIYVFQSPLILFCSDHETWTARHAPTMNTAGLIILGITRFILFSAISYGLARLSWRALEGPANDLKRHFKVRYNRRWSASVESRDREPVRSAQ